jgi:hypothetical protein
VNLAVLNAKDCERLFVQLLNAASELREVVIKEQR